jgi:hypothetical protein
MSRDSGSTVFAERRQIDTHFPFPTRVKDDQCRQIAVICYTTVDISTAQCLQTLYAVAVLITRSFQGYYNMTLAFCPSSTEVCHMIKILHTSVASELCM